MGVEESQELTSLQSDVDRALQRIGLEPSDFDEYVPHITLGMSEEIHQSSSTEKIDVDGGHHRVQSCRGIGVSTADQHRAVGGIKMSGTNYPIKCQTCKKSWNIEIYDYWFDGLKIDDSGVECYHCKKKKNPQGFYSHQCIICDTWFNIKYHNLCDEVSGIETADGPVCMNCVGGLRIKKA